MKMISDFPGIVAPRKIDDLEGLSIIFQTKSSCRSATLSSEEANDSDHDEPRFEFLEDVMIP